MYFVFNEFLTLIMTMVKFSLTNLIIDCTMLTERYKNIPLNSQVQDEVIGVSHIKNDKLNYVLYRILISFIRSITILMGFLILIFLNIFQKLKKLMLKLKYQCKQAFSAFRKIMLILKLKYYCKQTFLAPRRIMVGILIILLTGIYFKFIDINGAIEKFINFIEIDNERLISKVNINASYDQEQITTYSTIEEVENTFNVEVLKLEYIPQNFKFDFAEVNCDSTNDRIRITALYTNSDSSDNIVYSIYINRNISTNSKLLEEKTATEVKEYYYNGIKFFVFENNHWVSVRWFYNNIEYEIHGLQDEQEILNIIKNIKI